MAPFPFTPKTKNQDGHALDAEEQSTFIQVIAVTVKAGKNKNKAACQQNWHESIPIWTLSFPALHRQSLRIFRLPSL